MTKRESLEICIELWEWLSEKDYRSKEDWPGWDKYGDMDNDCPVCEYANGQRQRGCFTCPVEWVRGYYGNGTQCVSPESLYAKWIKSDGLAKDAKAVLALARKTLEELID